MKAFVQESLPNEKRSEQQWREAAENAIRKQTAHLWIVNGVPASMAFITRSTKNGASISLVYTPPAFRKKGYASAVVAHLSHKMLENGKQFCVLYTDLANPTSNKIYQDIGYREVTESMHFDFVELGKIP
ncbi:FR47-like protein [compost metagenome]